jgi:hypothetical protein
MMTSEDEEGRRGDKDLMVWALKSAKSGEKVILGSNYQEGGSEELPEVAEAPEPEPEAESQESAPEPARNQDLSLNIEEEGTLEDLKQLSPESRGYWEGRDLLFEASLVALAGRVLDKLREQRQQGGSRGRPPRDMIKSVEGVLESMKEGDARETKTRVLTLMEKWGAFTGGGSTFHFLRSFIRLLLETYPFE